MLKATVKEKDPINVKVDGKNYSVVRKLDGLKVPQTFNEKDVTINDETWTYTFASKPFNPKGIIGKVIYETTEEFAQELKDIKG